MKLICWLLGHKIVYPYAKDDPCGRCTRRYYKVRETKGGY